MKQTQISRHLHPPYPTLQSESFEPHKGNAARSIIAVNLFGRVNLALVEFFFFFAA